MRFSAAFAGLLVLVSLSDAALVQRRTYRNTEEILVPVVIVQDGEEIKEPVDLKEDKKETEIKNLEAEVIAENIAAAVDEEQKLEAVEAAVEAERRIDEEIVEEEIKEAVQEEQNKKIVEVLEKEKKLGTRIAETTQAVQSESNETTNEPAQEADQNEIATVTEMAQTSANIVATQEDANNASANDAASQSDVNVRQATQATPIATTTSQQGFIQFLQNSPLGQLFNQQNGTNQPFPTFPTFPTLPTLPAFNNPLATAQSFFTNATQGFQQFTSNLQNNFPNFGGQQQASASNNATSAWPPRPFQQFFASLGQPNPNPNPNPTQQGPFQGFISFFQGQGGNNKPQESTPATTNPAREPEIQEQPIEEAAVEVPNNNVEEANVVTRNSAEENDSFEESVQPGGFIVVNGEASETESNQVQGYPSGPY